jgi:hypothetical protein
MQSPCGLFEADGAARLPGELLPRGVFGRCHALTEGPGTAVHAVYGGAFKHPASEAVGGFTVDHVQHALSRHRY